jgi:hypothetical protein
MLSLKSYIKIVNWSPGVKYLVDLGGEKWVHDIHEMWTEMEGLGQEWKSEKGHWFCRLLTNEKHSPDTQERK